MHIKHGYKTINIVKPVNRYGKLTGLYYTHGASDSNKFEEGKTMTYTTYETEQPKTYTTSEMMTIYQNEIDHDEYETFSDWLYDMVKSGVYLKNGSWCESDVVTSGLKYTMLDAVNELMLDDKTGSWSEIETLDDLTEKLKIAESCYTDEYYNDGHIYRDILAKLV
jgi:hypothetical protein